MKPISLIANSGLQLIVVPVTLNYNDSENRLLFREWFDTDDGEYKLELVYQLKKIGNGGSIFRRKDLVKCGIINATTDEIVRPETEVLTNPDLKALREGPILSGADEQELFWMSSGDRLFMIDYLKNNWVPLPFYKKSNGKVMLGPYNWCRMRLIPEEESDTSDESKKTLKARVVIVFDTHAAYGSAESYPECPIFEAQSDMAHTYVLPRDPALLLDFVSGDNIWVRNALLSLAHGETKIDAVMTDITKGQRKYAFLASYIWLLRHIRLTADNLPEVTLYRDRGVAARQVDMVIDIGNSRTAAVLYDGNISSELTPFSRMDPLVLQNWTTLLNDKGELNRTEESFDMRVAFQVVNFGENLISGRGREQMRWPSIVRLGSEAQQLTFKTTSLANGNEAYSTYSSPKRYLWDQAARDKEWGQVSITGEDKLTTPSIPGLSGYFNSDGTINAEGYGYGYKYSRRTLMTLAFVEILTQATSQIGSFEYRWHRGYLDTPRVLGKIILTCPTGMSKKEQKALHQCLKDALFVLDKYNAQGDNDYKPSQVTIVPDLDHDDSENPTWMYDEATCSQFVYLYGLLTKTYLNCSGELFKLYGRERDGKQSIVIGSLDIGAGTSDIMIAQYNAPADGRSAHIKPVPLFWDSFDIAGDDMLCELIQNVLLQGPDGQLEQMLIHKYGWTENDTRGRLFEFFGTEQRDFHFNDIILQRDFNLQVLVPTMYHFLKLHQLGETNCDVTYSDIFPNIKPSEAVLSKFKRIFGIELADIVWHFDRETLSRHIVARLDHLLLEKVAYIMRSYGCDIVLLSGRPTGLEPVIRAFMSHQPVKEAQRLIALNHYEIGDWYPFIDKVHRRINNSKSIVPVGAIIGYLASGGGIEGFSIDMKELGMRLKPTTDYFVLDDNTNGHKSFITTSSNKGELKVDSLPIRIGARQVDIDIYPIRPFYVLSLNRQQMAQQERQNDKSLTDADIKNRVNARCMKIKHGYPLTITFSRPNLKDDKEYIEITRIVNNNKEEPNLSDFALTLQSLNDPDCYWIDSGVFDLNRGKN